MEPIVRPTRAGDIASVCTIYNHYVATTHVTFEEEPVHVDVVSERVAPRNREVGGSNVEVLLD